MTDSGLASGTPSTLRSINDRVALSLLLSGRPMSRNELSVQADVSKPTASQMVRRLESSGFVEVVGMVSSGRGPRTALYGARLDRLVGVAIDIQADVAHSTVVDAAGTAYPVAEDPREPGRSALDEVRAAVGAACAAAGVDPSAVVAVSIGLQASVATRVDQLILPSSLTGWPESGARQMLERVTGWSVTLGNDVNLAAAAERSMGSGRATHSFALLWIGHGIGLAVDIGGHVVLGSRGAAGEIGELRVPAGFPGATRFDDLFEPDAIAALAESHGLPGARIDDVANAARTSSQRGAFLAELAPRIAVLIPAITAVVDPETIVLGGPLGAVGGHHLSRLVADELAATGDTVPLITSASVIAHPVLTGARALLHDEIRTRLLDEAGAVTAS